MAENEKNELRDADTASDPNENNLPDEVLIDSASKLAHEDLPVRSEKEAEASETREGTDLEEGKSAKELLLERQDADEE